MKPANDLEKQLRQWRAEPSAQFDQRILDDAAAAMDRSPVDLTPQAPTHRWRAIMKSPWTRITSAAAAVVLAVVLVTMFNNSAVQAYALEQTVEANRAVRFVHVRINPPGEGLAEAWAQFAEDGSLARVRMDFPHDGEDGHKIVVWEAGKVTVWFKTKNGVLIDNEPNPSAFCSVIFDPQARVASLLRDRDAGKLESKIVSTPDGEMIQLVSPVGSDQQDVCYIAPATKLLRAVERYRIIDGQSHLAYRMEYLDFDPQQDPNVFTLNPPADAVRTDRTNQVIGLPRGDMTDEQITQQVAREFFEALIARDYAKAGRLFSGLPASEIERIFGKMKFVKVVSVGQPWLQPIPRVGGMVVPCTVIFEFDGQQVTREYKPAIRPDYKHPDRWEIHGGI
ncbi:MAG: hypothetical protein IT442_07830 [Phycisphaeraceae bacterium]|nr:hypothetical protein [Phycisphaeraceae bacterium]